MPQVYNKQIAMADATAFNKTSRFMSTMRMTEGSKRKIRAFNTVENRLKRIRIKFYDRHAEINYRKRTREQNKMANALKNTMAYKLVVDQRSLSKASNYKNVLNADYSHETTLKNVKHMIDYMEPEKVRERKAKALIEENRKRYDEVLRKSKETLDILCPSFKPKWRYRPTDEEDDDALSAEFGSRSSSRQLSRNNTRATISVKRQGITKSFVMANKPPGVQGNVLTNSTKTTQPFNRLSLLKPSLPPISVKS